MNRPFVLALLLFLPTLACCEPNKTMTTDSQAPAKMPNVPAGAETATLGGGCFWCIEAAYRQLDGVLSATSGYMGGSVKNPTYAQVCDKATGHAEVVQVVFDPKKISYERILAWFWDLHDPTSLNRQGNDEGPQYRSVIFYHSDAQHAAAESSKAALAKTLQNPVVTQIVKASDFYPAENYHQNYYFENKSKNGYCKFVIEPKLKKLKLEH
ncbi:MAG: peptide-methionine (S)-S-oxide reductase MsrA [Verrucomicrobia bacterium]|nr:MAG: peptide-methionine (S)-S-oxide reductase MsrA [Verrucomicrobiota bacterium]